MSEAQPVESGLFKIRLDAHSVKSKLSLDLLAYGCQVVVLFRTTGNLVRRPDTSRTMDRSSGGLFASSTWATFAGNKRYSLNSENNNRTTTCSLDELLLI